MPQLEHIEAIERRLWSAADTLRANSSYASNEYFLPVMGLVFLRHAYSRYLAVKPGIEASLPTRGGKRRALSKEDFSQQSAIFLKPKARFDYLVALPDSADRAKAVDAAMKSIEDDYESLRGVLPRSEYRELDNDVLGQLLRTLNPEELRRVSGDVFGRIYEYFLTQFADQKAHDGGEFFTPISLVSLIAHVLDPDRGTVLDPAAGSGGMFVQSARTVEEHGGSPAERLTFRGVEKNATTIRLAKMNLAVHGLEGDIQQAITYYEDPHELVGKADYIMANPPFNVDEIDPKKAKKGGRLPFGLPGINKKGKVGNGNYVWISYFYSYLNERGRAGFVMSSQASSAGRGEAKVRRDLIKTRDVDIMIAIRSNFFYTRTVPCELWFLNRDKPKEHRDNVLMIDARDLYRRVTRKIYDFSPEQQQNLLGIVWLYRGETDRFLELVSSYLDQVVAEGRACFEHRREGGEDVHPLADCADTLDALVATLHPFVEGAPTGSLVEPMAEFREARKTFGDGVAEFLAGVARAAGQRERASATNRGLNGLTEQFTVLVDICRDLTKRAEAAFKLAVRLIESSEKDPSARPSVTASTRDIARARKDADEARQLAADQLGRVQYFWRQARWLTERFPEAKLRDVDGLVKLVGRAEIEANDWSLSPGRYVGVAPEEEDPDFDFVATMREIHMELENLNADAALQAAKIKENFEDLGV